MRTSLTFRLQLLFILKSRLFDACVSSEGVQWFEYGRVQAINSVFVDKLIISVVITNNVQVYDVGCESVPYAGMYIRTLQNDGLGLDKAKEIIQSKMFYEYIKRCGTIY